MGKELIIVIAYVAGSVISGIMATRLCVNLGRISLGDLFGIALCTVLSWLCVFVQLIIMLIFSDSVTIWERKND